MKLFGLLIAVTVVLLGFWQARVLFLKSPPLPRLRIMTYSSFVSPFGPGRAVQKKFEALYPVRIQWIKIPDSTLFEQNLLLRKDRFQTDVIMGLDQITLTRFLNNQSFYQQQKLFFLPHHPHNSSKTLSDLKNTLRVPADRLLSKVFVPYNFSPMTFISNRPVKHKISLKDLLHPRYRSRISLPSAEHSTVGLQFLYWLWTVKGEQTKQFIKTLRPQLYGLPPSWSTSYALFQRGHVDLSFSYFSSLLYHQQQKQKNFYAVLFKEGHPFQVEGAGVLNTCRQCEWGRRFIHFLLHPEVQHMLMTQNYMLPVLKQELLKPETRTRLNTFFLSFLSPGDGGGRFSFPPGRENSLKLISYGRLKEFLQNQSLTEDGWE